MSMLRKQYQRSSDRALVIASEIHGLATISTHNFADTEHLPVLIYDISENGLGILTTNTLQRGQSVDILMSSPVPLALSGVVCWSRPSDEFSGFQAGIEIKKNQQQLTLLLDSIQKKRVLLK